MRTFNLILACLTVLVISRALQSAPSGITFQKGEGQIDVLIDGKPLTPMDHPGNLRYPTTWHVRDYGLFAANPFGLKDFTADKTQDGSYLLPAGKTLRFQYRIMSRQGDATQAKIADEYKNYLRDVK